MSCLIEIEKLTYNYPDGVAALDNIRVHIKHGQHVGLVGPNGAGKTTLFHTLAGIIESFEGSVVVAGCDVSTPEGRKAVHQKLGIVFQNADDQLFNATVYDDIAFGPLNLNCPPDVVKARVDEAVEMVQLNPALLARVPFHLSGGEKRRVALAGILAMKPQVLLLDEPTSDLDPRGRRELATVLRRFSLTRVISSHDLNFIAETCSRILVMDEGKIQADGPTEEILANAALMERHGLEVPAGLR